MQNVFMRDVLSVGAKSSTKSACIDNENPINVYFPDGRYSLLLTDFTSYMRNEKKNDCCVLVSERL